MDSGVNIDRGIDPGSLGRRASLAIAILMSFRTFQYFPGMQYLQELWYVLCLVALGIVYPVWKYATRSRFTSFEIYVLVLTVVAIVLPAWAARREFGQPLIYGLLAQRSAVLMVIPLLLLLGMRTRRISPYDIELALIWLAWGTFALYSLMLLFLNPENFVSYGVGFAQDVNGTVRFVQNSDFLVFALIYYTLLGFRKRRAKYYAAAAIFLIAVTDNANGRAFMVSLAATFLYFLYRWRPIGQFLGTIGKTCCVAVIMIGLGYAIDAEYVSTRAASFADAFKVAFTGSEAADASATIRIFETLTAWPYIQQNPLLGNGTLSHQWEGGDEGVLGVYFYASDIGIIGVVFAVGVFGLLLFVYQFQFAISAARKLKQRVRGPLADAAVGFLLCSALNSIATGIFFFAPEVMLVFIALVVALTSPGASGHRSASPYGRLSYAPGTIPGIPTSS